MLSEEGVEGDSHLIAKPSHSQDPGSARLSRRSVVAAVSAVCSAGQGLCFGAELQTGQQDVPQSVLARSSDSQLTPISTQTAKPGLKISRK